MNRQIKKAALASAVAAALGAGASVATADGILFPYLVKGNSVTTLLTVINRGLTNPLNLTYLYKIPTADANTEAKQNALECAHFDGIIASSKNDIITFDAGRQLGDDKFILFNDPGAGPNKYADTPAIVEEPEWIGQLVVDSGTDSAAADELFGEAMVFEWGSGAMWGYLAYNTLSTNPQDYSKPNDRNGEVLDGDAHPIDVVPMGESVDLTERLLVTPVSGNQTNQPFPFQDETVRVLLGVADPKGDRWYDRNEAFRSEPVAADVTCVGRITLKNYVSTSLKSFLDDGGNTDVRICDNSLCDPDGDTTVSEAIVQKLIYNTSNNGFPGATGLWNTAVWLRDMTAPSTSP